MDGQADIYQVAERLRISSDDLLPILQATSLLGFAEIVDGDIRMTPVGRDFATTTILRSKEIFREQAVQNVPMLTSIEQTLKEKRNGSMSSEFFLDLLDDHFAQNEAEHQFATAVDWGRYAELFEYDATEARLFLPQPQPVG